MVRPPGRHRERALRLRLRDRRDHPRSGGGGGGRGRGAGSGGGRGGDRGLPLEERGGGGSGGGRGAVLRQGRKDPEAPVERAAESGAVGGREEMGAARVRGHGGPGGRVVGGEGPEDFGLVELDASGGIGVVGRRRGEEGEESFGAGRSVVSETLHGRKGLGAREGGGIRRDRRTNWRRPSGPC